MPADKDETIEDIETLFDSAKLTMLELARSSRGSPEHQGLKTQLARYWDQMTILRTKLGGE